MTEVYTAGAFSKDGAGGNKAGVVLECGGLTAAEKIRIARELGYSETAFVSHCETADFALEYFTPAGEVPMCGHATIGTFTVLESAGMLDKREYRIQTKSGELSILIDSDGLIYMEQNAPQFFDVLTASDIGDCFGAAELNERLPIQIVSTGLRDIMLPVSDAGALLALKPDFEKIAALSRAKNCVGIHAFAPADGEITAVCRNFAPLYDINEEAATGTSNCALACYLYKYGVKRDEYVFEQGRPLGSVSEIRARLEIQDGAIRRVFVGGHGYAVGKTTV